MEKKIILGMDPGTSIMGFSIICIEDKLIKLVYIDELVISKISDPYHKLKLIFEKIQQIIIKFSPTEAAIEEPFYAKNIQSLLKLTRAQAVAMAACISKNLCVAQYLPRQVKRSITGNGNASKEQVAGMLRSLLKIKEFPTKHLDATDALAVAVCHHFNSGSIDGISVDNSRKKIKKLSSWAQYVSENQKKIT